MQEGSSASDMSVWWIPSRVLSGKNCWNYSLSFHSGVCAVFWCRQRRCLSWHCLHCRQQQNSFLQCFSLTSSLHYQNEGFRDFFSLCATESIKKKRLLCFCFFFSFPLHLRENIPISSTHTLFNIMASFSNCVSLRTKTFIKSIFVLEVPPAVGQWKKNWFWMSLLTKQTLFYTVSLLVSKTLRQLT